MFGLYINVMNIKPIQYNSNIYFRGSSGTTFYYDSPVNKLGVCALETHFMRDLDSIKFTTDYVKKVFPNGTNIANYGCSRGYETYSLGLLLCEANKDKKYKITGYDISTEAIEDAKTGLFNIGDSSNQNEKFLGDSNIILDVEQKQIKAQFDKYFERIPVEWKTFDINHTKYRQRARNFKLPNHNIGLTIKRLEHLLIENDRKDNKGEYYTPKNGIFNGIIDFKVSDIWDIDKELIPKETGIVVFKNALYHLLATGFDGDIGFGPGINNVRTLFKKINFILPQNGLFVLGTLYSDHLFDATAISPNDLINIYQKGKMVDIYTSSQIHNLLFKAGFEPVFYDLHKQAFPNSPNLGNIYLPSVWKKIKNIK